MVSGWKGGDEGRDQEAQLMRERGSRSQLHQISLCLCLLSSPGSGGVALTCSDVGSAENCVRPKPRPAMDMDGVLVTDTYHPVVSNPLLRDQLSQS